ncbi:Holliday junction branch migration protein RuvA [Mycetocola reblochoni]|uniref:Holliday junction branch migration complex subunit RuvA n=2 Tax=Mycetocola reblochoni TaxID=331618 RepID=A0A1R4J3I6_9MICO|nr:Holliday junction branch migration protein RuvA [Mycetocola reblochoni]RLP69490.1 Holliday junction branch migration protein RuvA [Mycetocola reblochoni]SJN26504.1 Holliday junction DNA helicase RuvA [Mycetocola reblochoni REB411]
MISSLTGTVRSAAGSLLVIDVHGVGYAVNVTPAHVLAVRVGHETTAFTELIVREDSLTLFGFEDAARVELFRILIGVTGVGPKSALGILAELDPADIHRAVVAEDAKPFTRVSGIGPKTAKLIVVSLAGKLGAFQGEHTPESPSPAAVDEILEALVSLGWSEREARPALDAVVAAHPAIAADDTAALLRLTLVALSGRGRGARA